MAVSHTRCLAQIYSIQAIQSFRETIKVNQSKNLEHSTYRTSHKAEKVKNVKILGSNGNAEQGLNTTHATDSVQGSI